jgi:hypothetical protein
VNADYYWAAIVYHDEQADQRLSFSESLQFVSRSAFAAITSVKDTDRLIMVLQATTSGGKPLPLTEIEATTVQVRRAGRTGIAFTITHEAVPSATATNKLFKGND